MPSSFPGSPRLLKGALITLTDEGSISQVILFQYNPFTLSRTLAPSVTEGESADSLRYTGAPVETLKVEVELDAADRLEEGDADTGKLGIAPQLAALELLLYPKSGDVKSAEGLKKLGMLEVVPPPVPLTLFVWGASRILPVRITEFSVTEEAHDPALNPLRAKVSLGMRVLSTADFTSDHRGWNLFMAHQVAKEAMAALATVGSAEAALGSNVSII